MITVTYFFDGVEGYAEKEYTGECAVLIANLEMDFHIRNGGYCMAGYKNKYILITNIKQLWGEEF